MMKTRKGYTVYPLTKAQKFHFFYLNFCPKKEVVNVGTSLTIEADLDWEVLKDSIRKADERCECIRIRFAADEDGEWYQYVVDKEEREPEFMDFRDKSINQLISFPFSF